mgnify:CR=1 FL=1
MTATHYRSCPLCEAACGVAIDVDGDHIIAVEAGVDAPPPESIRLDGLTMPAFANAHSHAFHRALRGRTHAGQGSFWTWRELMYAVADRLDLANADPATVIPAAQQALVKWQRKAESPLSSTDLTIAARVLVRTCEGILNDATQGV